MNCCVYGFGSIGRRHAEILKKLGHQVTVVSSYPNSDDTCYSTLDEAFANETMDYIVVAKPTAEHFQCLQELEELGFKGKVLVEKPLFSKNEKVNFSNKNIFVAYNLRFHPLIAALKGELVNEKALSAQVYVGQYLPAWRPDRDYRESYSAKKKEGGGVLRDLSHELDYLCYLFGDWVKVCAQQAKLSSLEIDSDDCVSLIMELERIKMVSLELNYLDRIGSRSLVINTDSKTIKIDFIAQTLTVNKDQKQFSVERNDSYLGMHKSLLSGETKSVTSYGEGSNIMSLIEAVEKSQESSGWVKK